MRQARLRAEKGEDGLYHCMSRIVGGEFLLAEKEKEFFVRFMWRVAAFLQIEVLDYVVMSNHYHQLVRVPGVIKLGDEDLLSLLTTYYGERSVKTKAFEKALKRGEEAVGPLRAHYLKRMGNVSEFEKILKQGFSSWYNRCHNRRGTLWMERFKSVLVEDSSEVRSIMASYIDLNPVRAEMVEDPKNYRHCGYGAAMGGDQRCRRGIMEIVGIKNWNKASAAYRLYLTERGHIRVAGKSGSIDRRVRLETLEREGRLPLSELLRLRIRYFSDGLVLGSELFVEEIFAKNRSRFAEKRKSGSRAIRQIQDRSLNVIRDLRLDPVS
jgi:REP element-mobilizing transposase RayT